MIKKLIYDSISCYIIITSKGYKRIALEKNSQSQLQDFLIIGHNDVTQNYIILLDDQSVGWEIGSFLIDHYKIDPKYLGQKFYEISYYFSADSESNLS